MAKHENGSKTAWIPGLEKEGADDRWESDDWEAFLFGREASSHLDFELGDGRLLRMHQNLHGASAGLGSADGLHTTVWEAAIALHLFILREERASPGYWKGRRALELGAGTG